MHSSAYEDIIVNISNNYTSEIYREPARFNSILADFSNSHKKEFGLVSIILKNKGSELLYKAKDFDDKKFQLECKKIAMNISEKTYIPFETIYIGLSLLSAGLNKQITFIESTDTIINTTLEVENSDNAISQNMLPSQKISCVSKIEQKAKAGDAETQCNLADLYYNGEGVTLNYEAAVKLYRASAEQGYAVAQNRLGSHYYNGDGVNCDYAEAVKWFGLSSQQGYAKAQCNLAICYELGKGVERDFTTAFNWFKLSAEQGNSTAQCNLGICYQLGKGAKHDFNKANKWFEHSANQNYHIAQFYLGKNYYNGNGNLHDPVKGMELLILSSTNGVSLATEYLIELENNKIFDDCDDIKTIDVIDEAEIETFEEMLEESLNLANKQKGFWKLFKK